MEKLTIGSKIPSIKSSDQNGKEINLSQFIGKKLVVYFYPKDDTPGCTAQACSLRDNFEILVEKEIVILGVSADSAQAHTKFIEKYKLPFSLLADTEKEIIKAFGVWGSKKFMGRTYDGIHRTSFLFNEDSTLIAVLDKPNTKDHANEILQTYKL
jgi:peroxiredoxin Q/BCP